MTSWICRLVLAGVLLAAPAWAQTPGPVGDPQTLSRGWAAVAAGRVDDAVSLAEGILKRNPRSHAGLTLKIEALSLGARPLSALDAYEAWLPKAGRNTDDRGLLESVASGILRSLVNDPDPPIRTAALQFLSSVGDRTAIEVLRQRSTAGDQGATLALAADGDTAALATLRTIVGGGTGRDQSAAIAAMTAHGGVPTALLDTLVQDRVPMNRAAAAFAVASSGHPEAATQLAQLSSDPDPLVRTSVTLAKARNGDEQALAEARAMLSSEVPDLRLMAAKALATVLPRESEQAVRPLLTDLDGLNRFRAAEIVGVSDPAAVRGVLLEGLTHENPLIQEQAARIAAEILPEDLALLRQLLRHSDRSIVVSAAGALVRY